MTLAFVNKALAQEEFGINDLSDAGIALGTKSIQETIAGIVNIFLGFLGILATLLILYAGFLWMTFSYISGNFNDGCFSFAPQALFI